MPAAVLLLSIILVLGACDRPEQDVAFACPDNALQGVFDIDQFRVLEECRWFRGVVDGFDSGPDDTTEVLVEPAEGSLSFLSEANYNEFEGLLPVVILPDQDLPLPEAGERIAVFGTWVQHVENEWNAIKPVWGIEYPDRGTKAYAVPATEAESAACICWRKSEDDGFELVLVRSESGEWSFPKGHTEVGETTAETAQREAVEEAGVSGNVQSSSFTSFLDPEGSVQREVLVAVHLLQVTDETEPLEPGRDPTWFDAQEAVEALGEGRSEVYVDRLKAVIEKALDRLNL